MWDMATSVILTDRKMREIEKQKTMMLMMIYGMGKDVAQAAAAVNGTTHLTSNTCKHLHHTTSEDLEIRLFSDDDYFYHHPTTMSLIEIFVM